MSEGTVKRGPAYDFVREEAFYQGLDPGIRFAVRVLHAAGFDTCQSCQGGYDHAYDRPTVDLLGHHGDGSGFGAVHALNAYGLPVRDVSILWRIENGLPTEVLWRITFREAMPRRSNDLPSCVRSTQSQWRDFDEALKKEGGLA